MRDVWRISRNASTYKENVFVKIARDGVAGYGEAAPNVRYGEDARTAEVVIREIGPMLEGEDWFAYTRVKEIIDERIVGQNCARAAVDMAVMDWVGKSLGVGLYKMFGLDRSRAGLTSYSIGIDEIDEIKRKTMEADAYPILKIKVGGLNDEEIIEAVRSVTDKPIRVDANEGWKDQETAVRKMEWMRTKGVEFVEQPMPAAMLEETAWVRERVEMELVADEAVMNAGDLPALAGVYDGINIKLMKAGGIQEALRMIHAAGALGLKVMLGCMIESSLAISAAAQLSPLAAWADLDGNLLIKEDPFRGVEVSRGRLVLNDRPGIGAEGLWQEA